MTGIRSNKREVGMMALGATAGVPLGTWLLVSVDPTIIRWAIVVLAALMLTLLISGWRYHGKPTATVTVTVGGLAGLSGGAAQIGGPPVIAYRLGGTVAATTVRANLLTYFAISTAITVVTYLAAGLLTTSIFVLAVVAGPAYGLGLVVGSRLFGFASETMFRRICYVLIGVAVALGLPPMDGVIR